LPPDKNPPPNSAINETAVTMYCSEISRAEVNLSIREKIRELTAANKKIKINPYRMDVPKLFDSMFLSPFKRHISKDKSKMTVPFLVQPYSRDSKSRMKTKKFKEDYSGYFFGMNDKQ
jgi:hypothetical protein